MFFVLKVIGGDPPYDRGGCWGGRNHSWAWELAETYPLCQKAAFDSDFAAGGDFKGVQEGFRGFQRGGGPWDCSILFIFDPCSNIKSGLRLSWT